MKDTGSVTALNVISGSRALFVLINSQKAKIRRFNY